MKKILKYVNSIPVAFTMRHYQTFGDSNSKLSNNELNSAESWDVLRKNHPQFSISKNREDWLKASEAEVKKDGQDGGMILRAKEVSNLLKDEKINKIFSVGVGGAGLEYQIKKNNPTIKVYCSEFAPENVSLLKDVFLEADEIIQFDILNGNWSDIKSKYLNDENSVLLMYRVDASFSDEEWKGIFKKIHSAGIKKVLFIPSSFLTLFSIFNRKLREFKWILGKTKIVFSGYLRTKNRFRSYWDGFYTERFGEFGGLKSYFLIKK